MVNQSTATRQWRCLNQPSPEIANIKKPNADTTGVIILDVNSHAYYDFELTCVYSATTVKDTVRVTVSYGTFPPQASTPIRMVTSQDVINYPGMSIGDAVIAGANDGPSHFLPTHIEVYFSNPAGISVGAGKHVWIMAGQYESLSMNFAPNQIKGTYGNPVIITNYGGQVEATKITLKNVRFARFTGKYEAGVSGNINYKGKDSTKAFTRGKYGIYANGAWQALTPACFQLIGDTTDHVEIDNIECANGNFAGMNIKACSPTAAKYVGIYIHDNYIHNTGGEGWYLGCTAGTNVNEYFDSLTIKNNITVFTGNEAGQFGQLSKNNIIENNVFGFAGMRWKSSFERFYQANAIQIGSLNGRNSFRNNLVFGAGDQMMNFASQQDTGRVASNNDTVHITNNYFGNSKGFIANYLGGPIPVPRVKIEFSNNVLARNVFKGDSVYKVTTPAGINTNQVLRAGNGGSGVTLPLIVKSNIIDASKPALAFAGNTVDSTGGNTYGATIAYPKFVNSGFSQTFTVNKMEYWADSLFTMWKDEYGPDATSRQYEKVYYNIGDTISFLHKYYVSKVNANTGNMPVAVTDAYWQKLTWTDGTTTYDYPPDDYRLADDDYFKLRNIGLTGSVGVRTECNYTGVSTVVSLGSSTYLDGSNNPYFGSLTLQPGECKTLYYFGITCP